MNERELYVEHDKFRGKPIRALIWLEVEPQHHSVGQEVDGSVGLWLESVKWMIPAKDVARITEGAHQ